LSSQKKAEFPAGASAKRVSVPTLHPGIHTQKKLKVGDCDMQTRNEVHPVLHTKTGNLSRLGNEKRLTAHGDIF